MSSMAITRRQPNLRPLKPIPLSYLVRQRITRSPEPLMQSLALFILFKTSVLVHLTGSIVSMTSMLLSSMMGEVGFLMKSLTLSRHHLRVNTLPAAFQQVLLVHRLGNSRP